VEALLLVLGVFLLLRGRRAGSAGTTQDAPRSVTPTPQGVAPAPPPPRPAPPTPPPAPGAAESARIAAARARFEQNQATPQTAKARALAAAARPTANLPSGEEDDLPVVVAQPIFSGTVGLAPETSLGLGAAIDSVALELPPATPPWDPRRAQELAESVYDDVSGLGGLYSRELMAAFQEASGLRSAATGLPDGRYGSRTRAALAHWLRRPLEEMPPAIHERRGAAPAFYVPPGAFGGR
jgi:hypothetical protein